PWAHWGRCAGCPSRSGPLRRSRSSPPPRRSSPAARRTAPAGSARSWWRWSSCPRGRAVSAAPRPPSPAPPPSQARSVSSAWLRPPGQEHRAGRGGRQGRRAAAFSLGGDARAGSRYHAGPRRSSPMPSLRPELDPDGLLEFSVVFTDRSLNHMSRTFQGVMRDIHAMLCEVHNASRAVVVPGGGTYAMEAVARQFATGRKVLVVRNGFFSYRWSQIFQMGAIPEAEIVLKARRAGTGPQAPFAPPPIDEVVAAIAAERPEVVFAPHVETASGMILPDAYIRAVADAVHQLGGLFVLDGVASGCI